MPIPAALSLAKKSLALAHYACCLYWCIDIMAISAFCLAFSSPVRMPANRSATVQPATLAATRRAHYLSHGPDMGSAFGFRAVHEMCVPTRVALFPCRTGTCVLFDFVALPWQNAVFR